MRSFLKPSLLVSKNLKAGSIHEGHLLYAATTTQTVAMELLTHSEEIL
jgi:hypothetical protein